MAFIRCLPETASLADVKRAFPEPMRHLVPFVQSLMRGPSPFTTAERELIAAYVSGVNACGYCHGIHAATAAAFGVDETVFAALMEDVEAAPADERLKPVLRYVLKLTRTPSKMAEADAEAVYDAGWDDTALFHAVAICAYYNLMNRIAEGAGVNVPASQYRNAAERLFELGYTADETAPT